MIWTDRVCEYLSERDINIKQSWELCSDEESSWEFSEELPVYCRKGLRVDYNEGNGAEFEGFVCGEHFYLRFMRLKLFGWLTDWLISKNSSALVITVPISNYDFSFNLYLPSKYIKLALTGDSYYRHFWEKIFMFLPVFNRENQMHK